MGLGSANAAGDKTLVPHRVGTMIVDIVFDPLRNNSKMFNAALLNLWAVSISKCNSNGSVN